ncbi:hypothetical protein GCM10022224_074540 [Nonomuraea antimicrobica]|uniref:Uncharacterized protein n=2 Tax=Nonomuraea antimicrobica TaxID=561173 RepID=A0ABP7D213_9ACTN
MRTSATKQAKQARRAGRGGRATASRRAPREDLGHLRDGLPGGRRAGRAAARHGDGGIGRDAWAPERPPRRARRAWYLLAGLTVVLAAGCVVAAVRPDLLGSANSLFGEPLDAASLPARDPFAGSPAADYAEGITGFALPAPKALGGLSEQDVAKGLERTRELLAAAYLDRTTLLGGPPDAFAALLDADQRDWFRDNLDGSEYGTRNMVTSFAPGTAELTTGVVKVRGSSTLDTFEDDGLRGVSVKLNHVLVYAVQLPGRPDTAIRLVVHAKGEARIHRERGRIVVLPEGWTTRPTPASCDFSDWYIHPVYRDTPPGTVAPTGPRTDPYDLDQPDGEGCALSDPT